MKFKWIKREKINELPKTPGVYTFKNNREILYIGKAANIKERVKNHFSQPAFRDNFFIGNTEKIGFAGTYSEIEALILESQLIKKHLPKYNVMWKDDKNYFYVAVTRETLPRVSITHQLKINPSIGGGKLEVDFIGPFVDGGALKQTLRILRRIFPYYTQKTHPEKLCLYCHIKLCPGPDPDAKEYRKSIRNLIAFLRGKRNSVLKNLKKEMELASKSENYEKAGIYRDKIAALEGVLSHAKILEPRPLQNATEPQRLAKIIQKILKTRNPISRVEAYDISNIQGQEATGSMVTFIDGKPDKNFYRKFKIHITGKPNDTAMIQETLRRRFGHKDWQFPDLILIDGGKPQLGSAVNLKSEIPDLQPIPLIALAKKRNELFSESRKEPILLKTAQREIFNLILHLRDEAHRFARKYHLKLRKNDLLPNS